MHAHTGSSCSCTCGCQSLASHDSHATTSRGELRRLGSSLTLLIAAILCDLYAPEWWHPLLRLGVYIAAYLPVAWGVIRAGWHAIVREKSYFNEFTLMTVATLGAFGLREYPEAVALMLLYSVGEWLQGLAVARARRNIGALIDVRPDTVMRLLPSGEKEEILSIRTRVGDRLVLSAGERVPVDGYLLSPHATLDLAALTGESYPEELVRGEVVMAGAIVVGTPLEMEVTKPYNESTLARILALVEESAEHKPPTERFIRRFARIYTPIVALLALLIVLLPWGYSFVSPYEYLFRSWLYRGLVFLVTSCPCALVISVPLAFLGGVGAAGRHGLLVKGATFLDAFRRVRRVVFDKTGTLTTGHFSVVEEISLDVGSEEFWRGIAKTIESQSNHPAAQAVAGYLDKVPTQPVDELTELPGLGMQAYYRGAPVWVGSLKMMQEKGVSVPSAIVKSTKVLVLLAVSGRLKLVFLLGDELKPTSRSAVQALKQLGVEQVVMLSGDRPEVVREVAAELGLDAAFGGLMPQDKVQHVAKMVREHEGAVVFVGDGINDAPVMAASHIGLAMGGIGSDAAIEAADVVIQSDDPLRVTTAIRLSRFTSKIVRENIIFALSVKAIVMLLATLGIASLLLAILADVGVSLLAVLNAIRTLYYKEPKQELPSVK